MQRAGRKWLIVHEIEARLPLLLGAAIAVTTDSASGKSNDTHALQWVSYEAEP